IAPVSVHDGTELLDRDLRLVCLFPDYHLSQPGNPPAARGGIEWTGLWASAGARYEMLGLVSPSGTPCRPGRHGLASVESQVLVSRKMNRRRFVNSICATTLLSALDSRGIAGMSPSGASNGQRVWPRPTIVPVPAVTAGLTQPVVNLAGVWKFTLNPPERFWDNGADLSTCSDIQVPGECVTQGFPIARDSEYPFKKHVPIPTEFRGQRIFLRFDGVYSFGRLWVNGTFVRDHQGGFTTWEADITDLVKPGEPAWITLAITDRSDEISYGSHYAKHSIGGILRDVRLIAVPPNHLSRLHVATDLDASYSDAMLEVTAAVSFSGGRTAAVRLQLEDSQNRQVPLKPSSIALTPADAERTVRIPVEKAQKWDAEHPYLYTLRATLVVDDAEVETVSRKLGLRKVAVSGDRLL